MPDSFEPFLHSRKYFLRPKLGKQILDEFKVFSHNSDQVCKRFNTELIHILKYNDLGQSSNAIWFLIDRIIPSVWVYVCCEHSLLQDNREPANIAVNNIQNQLLKVIDCFYLSKDFWYDIWILIVVDNADIHDAQALVIDNDRKTADLVVGYNASGGEQFKPILWELREDIYYHEVSWNLVKKEWPKTHRFFYCGEAKGGSSGSFICSNKWLI